MYPNRQGSIDMYHTLPYLLRPHPQAVKVVWHASRALLPPHHTG
jgi:hypothetical protein